MNLGTYVRRALRGGAVLFLVLPSSTNYKLQSYSFGDGGAISTSTNFSQNGQTGQTAGYKQSSTNYLYGAGVTFTEQADVPPAPTFINSGSTYNRLLLTVNPGPNASDATYAIAVSSDGFVTTNYLRSDGTLGSSLTIANYQSYALWGGSSGSLVLGLAPHTTYAAKVSARHGAYTATGFGPSASAATLDPSLAFSLATTTQPTPPFSINFGSLTVGTVITSPQNVLVTFATNGLQGGSIYLIGQNAGLSSVITGYTIASATTNLATASEGFGAQSVSATQTSGGPFTASAPYTGSASNVGAVSTTPTAIYSAPAPLVGGSGAFSFMAKSAASDSAATDYKEVATVTASANF